MKTIRVGRQAYDAIPADHSDLRTQETCPMARMRVKSVEGRYQVTVTGNLGGRDLRRLERACAPALEQPRLPLTVRLASVRAIDHYAKAYLDRLMQRGAVVLFE